MVQVVLINRRDDVGRNVLIVGAQRRRRRARPWHHGTRGVLRAGDLAPAQRAGRIAEHDVQVVVAGAVQAGQVAHIRRLQREQDRVEAVRPPPLATRRHDLVDRQLLAVHQDVGVGAQAGQRALIQVALRLPRLISQGVQLRIAQLQAQGAGPLLHRQRARRQRERDRQVGVGLIRGACQRVRRAVQHALAARRVTQRGQRHRARVRRRVERVVHGERELVDVVRAAAGHQAQIAQDFLADVPVQAVVVGQAHQMLAIHRRLERGVVLVRRQVQRQILAAFSLCAQVRADAAQRDRGGLQRPHARPIAVVLGQLRVQVGQNLGRDGRIRLLGGGAGIGQFTIQQRTAVQRDVDAAQFRVDGRLRVRPVHRLDQGQVGIQHVLRQVDALVGAGRAARKARLSGEALARIDRQRLGRRAYRAIARVQFDAVARHDGIGTARRRMGKDTVTRLDVHRACRRVHILKRRPRAITAVREVVQADVVACFRAGVAVGPHHVERDRATQRDGVHVDLRAGARGHLPVHIARHDADFALHRDRCRRGRRHGFNMHRLAVAHDQVARQRDIAIAADVDRVVGVAGAHEAQRDLLRGRHVEGEQLLLLLLDHLRQGRRLGTQPAAAAGVRAVVTHDDAGVELAISHAEDRRIQRRAARGVQAVVLAVGAFDAAVGVFHQRLRAAAFDRGGQQRVIQLAAGNQLLLQRIRHGIDAVIRDNRRHQHGARRLEDRHGAGLAGVLVGQPAQRIEVAKQVELLGGVDGGGGFARTPAHHPHHHLTGLGLVAQGQRIAVLQRAGSVAGTRRVLLAVAAVVHPDPAQRGGVG